MGMYGYGWVFMGMYGHIWVQRVDYGYIHLQFAAKIPLELSSGHPNCQFGALTFLSHMSHRCGTFEMHIRSHHVSIMHVLVTLVENLSYRNMFTAGRVPI